MEIPEGRARLRVLNILRKVILRILSLQRFSLAEVASNHRKLGVLDATLLSGTVPEYASRLVSRLVRFKLLVRTDDPKPKYWVNPGAVTRLKRLKAKTPKADHTLLMLAYASETVIRQKMNRAPDELIL